VDRWVARGDLALVNGAVGLRRGQRGKLESVMNARIRCGVETARGAEASTAQGGDRQAAGSRGTCRLQVNLDLATG
jgi:hypothetical protein